MPKPPPYTELDQKAELTLIAHQRRDVGSCACGWGVDTGDWGQSHALHVWRALQTEMPLPLASAPEPPTTPNKIRVHRGPDGSLQIEVDGQPFPYSTIGGAQTNIGRGTSLAVTVTIPTWHLEVSE